jgi:uncharacterized RDD family membrane protein YckC
LRISVLHLYHPEKYGRKLSPASLRDRIMAQLIDGIVLGIIIGLYLAVSSRGELFSVWISPMVPIYLVQPASGYVTHASDWWWGGYYFTVSLPIIADFHVAYPSAVQWLIYGIYYSVFHHYFGQTVGKMMKGIVVLTSDGRSPAFGQSIVRWLGYLPSLLPAGFGFWFASFHPKILAWHDRLTGTGVAKFMAVGED